jgi:ATP-dependent Zn protease
MSDLSPAAILYDETGEHAVGVVLDGTVYRLQVIGKVQDANGTTINPATEEQTFKSGTVVQDMLAELRRVRVLLEILTDEEVSDRDAELER